MSEQDTESFDRVDLTVACANCGAYIEEHPGGYCPDTISDDLEESPRFRYPEEDAMPERTLPPQLARQLISAAASFKRALDSAAVKGADSFSDEEASQVGIDLLTSADLMQEAGQAIDDEMEHA